MSEPFQHSLLEAVLPAPAAVLPVGQKAAEKAKKTCPTGPKTPVRGRTNDCPTLKRKLVGQDRVSSALAQASPPSAAPGGTPLPKAREAQSLSKKKQGRQRTRGKRIPPTGREAGGPACIGCRHFDFELNRRQAACAVTGRSVAALNRRPCGSYQFWHAARLEAAAASPPPAALAG
jgi:hypothetical protein